MSSVIDLRAYVNPSVVQTLVLVDLQQEYTATPRVLALENTKAALANCRAALAHARAMGLPVAFVRWIDRTPLFNKATRFSRWIEGFEINTDAYTRATEPAQAEEELAKIRDMAALAQQRSLRVYAGHGLRTDNVGPVAAIPNMEELNIGHFIVGRAVMVGIEAAVREMLAAIRSA